MGWEAREEVGGRWSAAKSLEDAEQNQIIRPRELHHNWYNQMISQDKLSSRYLHKCLALLRSIIMVSRWKDFLFEELFSYQERWQLYNYPGWKACHSRWQFVKRGIEIKPPFQRCRYGGKFNRWNCRSFSISHTFLEILFHTTFSESSREFVFWSPPPPPLIAVTTWIVFVTKGTSSKNAPLVWQRIKLNNAFTSW